MRAKSALKKQTGFTLIEVMIAVTIMGVLTILTSRAIREGVMNKEKFQGDMNRESAVRDALRIMQRDINLTYHHRDFYTDMLNQANQQSAQQQQQQASATAGGQAALAGGGVAGAAGVGVQQQPAKTPPPEYTAFEGDEASLDFTTMSNVRMQKDSTEGDIAVVGYSIKDCRTMQTEKSTRSKCLFRRTDPILTDDITQGGTETVLLENVDTFTLRYLGPGSDDWQKEWKTKTSHTDGKKDWPYAVEITLKTHNKQDPKDKPFGMQMVSSIRFPNNQPPQQQQQNGQPGQTGTNSNATAQ